MRTDPTDTGGLFVGRRPGTAPVKYRKLPERAGEGRRSADDLFAHGILALMVFVNLLFWGPIPLGSLWVASRIEYWTDSVSIGIFLGFCTLIAVLLLGLVALKRLDHFWILVRRAAGHDQREGIIGRVFGATAVVGAALFFGWLLLFAGLGPSLAPSG